MAEHREQDPKRVESLRMQIDSLIQNYLNQKPTPGIADFAEAFGAEAYVVEMKRQKATTVNIKAFREELVDRLISQGEETGIDVVLPKVFEMLPQTILPPDEGEIKTGSGEGIEKKKYIPRTQYLIELLSEMGESYEIIGGQNSPDMMRERTYFIFFLPNSEKAIFVNNEEGNTTFIIYEVNSKDEAIKLAGLTKDEIRAKEHHNHPFVQVDWTGDYESWKAKLSEFLIGSVPENWEKDIVIKEIIDEETVIDTDREKYEKAPEGWMNIKLITKQIKKTKEWLVSRINYLLLVHPEWQPKPFLYTSGNGTLKKALYYPLELITELKKEVDKLQKAPEGWMTSLSIVKKIKKDRKWIAPRIKELVFQHPDWEPKIYLNMGNKEVLHYCPELVTELELQALSDENAPEGWLTTKGIAVKTGKSERWVVRKLTDVLTNHPEWKPMPYLDTSKKRVLHYPVELIQYLVDYAEKFERAPEGWMTATSMLNSILEEMHKNAGWVNSRIKDLVNKHSEWQPEMYLDFQGKEALHYPPELFFELKRLARLSIKAPEGWMSIGVMTKKFKKNYDMLKKQVAVVVTSHPNLAPVKYSDINNNEVFFYPPALVQKLEEFFAKQEKAPQGWLQLTTISRKLSRDNDWVRPRISSLVLENPHWQPKEYINNETGHLGTHYPPELIDELKIISESETK